MRNLENGRNAQGKIKSIPSKIRTLIVDDHRDYVDLFVDAFPQDEFVMDAVYSGQEAFDKLKSIHYDLVILDYDLPDINGIEILKFIKSLDPMPITFLVTGRDDLDGSETYALKGHHFFRKPVDINLVIAAAHRFTQSSICDLHLPLNLSAREAEVLKLTVEGFTSKEIAEKFGISFRTVEKHREHILKIFKVNSVIELISVVLRKSI